MFPGQIVYVLVLIHGVTYYESIICRLLFVRPQSHSVCPETWEVLSPIYSGFAQVTGFGQLDVTKESNLS